MDLEELLGYDDVRQQRYLSRVDSKSFDGRREIPPPPRASLNHQLNSEKITYDLVLFMQYCTSIETYFSICLWLVP